MLLAARFFIKPTHEVDLVTLQLDSVQLELVALCLEVALESIGLVGDAGQLLRLFLTRLRYAFAVSVKTVWVT